MLNSISDHSFPMDPLWGIIFDLTVRVVNKETGALGEP